MTLDNGWIHAYLSLYMFEVSIIVKNMWFGCVFSKKYMTFAQIPNVSYVGKKISFSFFKKSYLFFDWMIIALQNFVFCQTSTQISRRYMYVPYLLKFCHLSYYIFFLFHWNWNLPVYPFLSGLWAPWGQLMVWHCSAEPVPVWVGSLSFIQRYLLSLLLCSNF